MKTLCIAAAAALLLWGPAGAATVKYKGHDYGSFDTNYFTDNPTAVGSSRSVRFSMNYCASKAEQLESDGEKLEYCDLDYAIIAGTPDLTFFDLSVDGSRGKPMERTWFFTLTFRPTHYIDPLTADGDEIWKLFAEIYISFHWDYRFGGNNADFNMVFEGAVIPPAPVPLPASGALAVVGLAALTALRRKPRKV